MAPSAESATAEHQQPVVGIEHIVQFLTVVDAGVCDFVFSDQLVLAVDVDVVLVAVKGCLVLLRPARIGVLVRFFLAVPVGRNPALLDRLIVVATVALARDFDKSGVDDLSAARRKACRAQHRVELREQFFHRLRRDQLFPKQPYRSRVRNSVAQLQPQKPHEAHAIQNLIFGLFVRKIIQGLQHQNLEHQNRVIRRTPAFVMALPLKRLVQHRPEDFPGHQKAHPLKKIPRLQQLLLPLGKIEQPRLLHSASL